MYLSYRSNIATQSPEPGMEKRATNCSMTQGQVHDSRTSSPPVVWDSLLQ
jgi:hypothetical protein